MSTAVPSRSTSRTDRARAERAAAAARAAQQRRRRRVAGVLVAAVLGVAATAGIVVGMTSRHQAGTVPPTVTAAGGIVVGEPTAAVKVVMYEDPQCPVCKRFEDSPNAEILRDAVRSGKASVEYRMRSFLGKESVRAVNALAAAQAAGRFDALRTAMFAHQPAEGTGGYATSMLVQLGRDVGLKDASYAQAVKDMTYEGWVRTVDERGSRDGNVGTPELRVMDHEVSRAALFGSAEEFRRALGL